MYDNARMDKKIDWGEHITANPKILGGKATIKGTRISVELILELVGGGWSIDQILEGYPHLTHEGARAALAYAIEVVREDHLMPIASSPPAS